ncbi:hypothetical protein [Micromonospora chersina]|uniref:hypothetical protein n=1 Tax=Micromonospora chersina TaxID=47854 RepID=UPI00371355B7
MRAAPKGLVTVKPFQGKISLDVRDSLPDWAALRLSGFHPAATVLGHPHLPPIVRAARRHDRNCL